MRWDSEAPPAIGRAHRELWEVVRDELRRLIVSGEFSPGERLSSGSLAERFEVSRGPVLTAFTELERVGLLTSTPRRGVQVATFERQDLDELYDATLALERMAARWAAERATPEQTSRLSQLLDALELAERSGDPMAIIDADLEFHRQLMRSSGNRRLFHLWMQLSEQIRLVIALTQRALPDVEWSRSLRPIVEAVQRRNIEQAEEAVVSCFTRARVEVDALSPEALDAVTGRTARAVAR